MGLTGTLLLGLALVIWMGLVANIRAFGSSDAAGNGLAEVYAVGTAILLWIVLAILLIVAALRGPMPGAIRLAAVLLVPLSGAAALGAIQLLSKSGADAPRWPFVIPALVPPLIIAYAAWLMMPALRAALPSTPVAAAVWGIVLLLSLTPWAPLAAGRREVAVRRAEIVAEAEVRQQAEDATKRAERRARFAKLGPQSRLWDWIDFADPGSELRDEALAGARALTHRQVDAEVMAARGFSTVVREAPNLDLEATPAFCDASRKVLAEQATWLRPDLAEPPPYSSKRAHVEQLVAVLVWLSERRCDVSAEALALADAVRGYQDAPERARAVATLDSLGRGGGSR